MQFLWFALFAAGIVAVDQWTKFLVLEQIPLYGHVDAIDAYRLGDKVVNSHRAIDDVLATVAVMEAMATEKDDLEHYVNLFGYNPKYGIEGKAIGSVTYKPQPYNPRGPLYEV